MVFDEYFHSRVQARCSTLLHDLRALMTKLADDICTEALQVPKDLRNLGEHIDVHKTFHPFLGTDRIDATCNFLKHVGVRNMAPGICEIGRLIVNRLDHDS